MLHQYSFTIVKSQLAYKWDSEESLSTYINLCQYTSVIVASTNKRFGIVAITVKISNLRKNVSLHKDTKRIFVKRNSL